ncbi:hypothetical protein L2E82_12393 [Cichorium intybus]|uniref:Uncharacterized protein n=1 Tax=Cichorium intybus TaxID=13427 RepID=A0ACB9GFS7_CICIN|nr:hypothetical protein L2E82_12393 [Cichorium intybus]
MEVFLKPNGAKFVTYEKKYKEDARELKAIVSGESPINWEKALPIFCRHWSRHIAHGSVLETEWNAKFVAYEKKYKEDARELKALVSGESPINWEKALLVFPYIS